MIKLQNVNLMFKERSGNIETIKDVFIELTSLKNIELSTPLIIHSLNNISFEVKEGDHLALLGKNGSGKSSLCLLLSKYYHPDTGTLINTFNTRHIHSSTSAIFPDLSSWDNTILILHLLYSDLNGNEVKDLANSVFEFADLNDFKELPIRKFSKGMNARLILSIVTAMPAELLIIDELFDGADKFFMEKFEPRLEQTIKNSKSTIFVSHNLEIIKKYSNRAIVLEKGKIVFDGNISKGMFYYQSQGWIHT